MTDVSALLPQTQHGPELPLVREIANRSAGAVALGIETAPGEAGRHREAMDTVRRAVAANDLFVSADGATDALIEALLPHRDQLLSTEDRRLLSEGAQAAFARRALEDAMGMGALSRLTPLARDPFGTLNRYLMQQLPAADGEADADVLRLTLRQSPHEQATHEALSVWIADLEASLPDGVRLLRSGAVFHSMASAARAQSDLTRIGIISTLGLLLLVGILFRSAAPLLLVFGTVAGGCALGALAGVLVFDELHIIALVFSTGLIGISADYAFHVACAAPSPEAHRRTVVRALVVAALTSVCAYLALTLTDMQLFQQVGVVGAAGLIGALGCALWGARAFSDLGVPRGLPATDAEVDSDADAALMSRGTTAARALGAGLVLMAVGVIAFVPVSADIGALSMTPEAVLEEEREFAERFGGAGSLLRISGVDSDQVAVRAHDLRTAAMDMGVSSRSLADLIPPMEQQRRNQRWMQEFRDAALPGLAPLRSLDEADASVRVSDRVLRPAALPEVLRAGALSDGSWLAVLPARDARQAAALAAASDGVTVVDTPGLLSGALEAIAADARTALLVSLFAALCLLALRYGSAAPWLLAPAVIGVAAGAGVAWAIADLGVFHLMGAFMVIGFGIDYAVFRRESNGARVRYAVALSVVSTLWAFGLLATSQIQGVHDFGLMVAVGTLTAWVTSRLLVSSQ